jgi:hypothetical protein
MQDRYCKSTNPLATHGRTIHFRRLAWRGSVNCRPVIVLTVEASRLWIVAADRGLVRLWLYRPPPFGDLSKVTSRFQCQRQGLEAIEAAPPSWAVTLALGENPREVALVNKTTELGNISELTPRIL